MDEPPVDKKPRTENSFMPKINKDFSDALGFRLLSSYTSFATEYPVEGAKIQKIYDDNFRDTCYKCYPIIAEAGVDPLTFTPKQPAGALKSELRKLFPVKHKPEETAEAPTKEKEAPKGVIDLESDNDDETTSLSNLTQKVSSPKRCKSCERLAGELKTKQVMIENLTKQNVQMADIITEKNKVIHQKTLQLQTMQKELLRVKNELDSYKNDVEFMSIIDYQRKKRRS